MAGLAHLTEVSKKLWVSHHIIEAMIGSFPPLLMTPDRVNTFEIDLKEIHDKYLEFSAQVAAFSQTFLDPPQPTQPTSGVCMNVSWWINTEKNIQSKVNAHQVEIRKIARGICQCMSEYDKQHLKLKRKQLEMLKRSYVKSQEEAIVHVQFDNFHNKVVELDKFLDQIEELDRSEVIPAMKNMEKLTEKLSNLYRDYKEFKVSNYKYLLPDLSGRMDELEQKTSDRYKKFEDKVKTKDNNRELLFLGGESSVQVKLPTTNFPKKSLAMKNTSGRAASDISLASAAHALYNTSDGSLVTAALATHYQTNDSGHPEYQKIGGGLATAVQAIDDVMSCHAELQQASEGDICSRIGHTALYQVIDGSLPTAVEAADFQSNAAMAMEFDATDVKATAVQAGDGLANTVQVTSFQSNTVQVTAVKLSHFLAKAVQATAVQVAAVHAVHGDLYQASDGSLATASHDDLYQASDGNHSTAAHVALYQVVMVIMLPSTKLATLLLLSMLTIAKLVMSNNRDSSRYNQ